MGRVLVLLQADLSDLYGWFALRPPTDICPFGAKTIASASVNALLCKALPRLSAILAPMHIRFAYVLWQFRAGARKSKKSTTCVVLFLLFGDPYGNRTHAFAVRGRRLSRLTNGPKRITWLLYHIQVQNATPFCKIPKIFFEGPRLAKFLREKRGRGCILPVFLLLLFRRQRRHRLLILLIACHHPQRRKQRVWRHAIGQTEFCRQSIAARGGVRAAR